MYAFRFDSRYMRLAATAVLVFAVASLDSPAATLTAEATTTSLSASPNPVRCCEPVTMSANVATRNGKIPAGNVNFYDGKSLLATVALDESGAATYSVALAVGTHHLKAVYAGDKSFAGSTSNAVVENVIII